jgi:ketosteroid isomerase-like protein
MMSEFMHDYIARMEAGDFAGAAEYYADDLVAHQSGRSKWAGTRTGKEEMLAWLGEITGSLDDVQITQHALTTGDGHAVALTTFAATNGDKSYRGNRAVVYHTEGDKITELWVIDEDQYAIDEFFA